jgi:chloramphenicol O-acetyltransferase
MAVLHRKEEKIEVVLSKLPKDYTEKQFVDTFIQLYSKDWGKIKANYIKQSQDKEPGTVITMPKPDLYLLSILKTYLENSSK